MYEALCWLAIHLLTVRQVQMMVAGRSGQASALLAVLFCSAIAVAADNGYHVLARYKLAGRGKTANVRIDAEARRLYVAHGDRVDVLNLDTGALAGSIPASGSNDIVLAPEAKHGFVSNSTSASLIMFDPATLKVLKTIKLNADKPGALEYDPDVKRVFVATNGGVTAIDSDSGEVSGNVSLEGRLRSLVSNNYGRLYVAAEDKNVVHVVDTSDLKFLGDFPIGNGQGPSGLALDPSGRRLFVACSNGHLPIVDTDIGFTFQELEIGKGAVNDVFTFTPQGKGGWRGAVFAASSDGTLSLIKMNAFISYSHEGEIKIQPGIDSLAFDPKTHHLFLPASSGAAEILVVGQ
jgi:DNA-binding beta-propeller fold protein YncE